MFLCKFGAVIPKYKNALIATVRAAEQSPWSLVKFVF